MIEDIDWGALTIKQEGEGEDFVGKLCIAFTIVTRMKQRKLSVSQTVLQPFQYSCWNADSPTRNRLKVDMTSRVWIDAYQAMREALSGAVPDPTGGCESYLNPAACTPRQRQRAGYKYENVKLIHGKHHFFKAI